MDVSRKNTPGGGLIKVNGILMIILNTICLIGVLANGLAAVVAMMSIFVPAALGLIAGIVGIKDCGRKEKANVCFAWGIVAEASAVIGLIVGSVLSVDSAGVVILLVVCPILYIIGAIREKNAARRGIIKPCKINDDQKDAPGRGLLKVVGILMIIFSLAFFGVLVNGLLGLTVDVVDKNLAFLMFGVGLTGVFQFVAGIVGVRNCGRLKKATTCLAWGTIAETSAVVGIILIFTPTMGGDFRDEWGLCVVPIFPILYIIGAVLNRNTAHRVKP